MLDEGGHPIAVVTRREMRARRLPHRSTYILVLNTRDELFVHLRTPTKDLYPSHWDTCVGGVPLAGEDFATGAARELAEEIGVTAPLEELFPCRWTDADTDVHGMVYRARHDGPFVLQPEEVVRGEFVALDVVAARVTREPFCPDGVAVLQRYLERNVRPARARR